jgi:hypothetical protein
MIVVVEMKMPGDSVRVFVLKIIGHDARYEAALVVSFTHLNAELNYRRLTKRKYSKG